MEPHWVALMAVTALGCIGVMLLNTSRRKPSADHEQIVRSAILQLFKLATSQDYSGAATLMLGPEGTILRYSQQAEEVERRCRELQELAEGGGICIERVLPQGDEGHPDYVCELSVVGSQRRKRQQRWRWTGDRYAWLGDSSPRA